MAVTERIPRPARTPVRWQGRAFGLTIESTHPVPFVPAAPGPTDSPTVEWHVIGSDELASRCDEPATPVTELRHPDGRLFMGVDRDRRGSYRVRAPGYGAHVVAGDGSAIRSWLPHESRSRWPELFLAQTLPLAAALRGLDLLHASAVEVDGRALAFVGAPGAGKTSIASHLVGLGRRFVTDDVLAVSAGPGSLLAHPGPAVANLEPHELDALPAAARIARRPASADDKLRVDTHPVTTPLPLGAVVFVRRRLSTPALRLTPHAGPRSALLGCAFLGYMQSPERLAGHLEVCGRLAAGRALLDIEVPAAASASETARFLHERLPEALP
jgi:hypothetical protein